MTFYCYITLQVKVGDAITIEVGTLNFLEFWETTYFIGIMCGIGGLILLILVVIIFCCCRRRGGTKPQRASTMTLVPMSDQKGNGRPSNHYTECKTFVFACS